jgi:hypothetical protein
LTSGGPCGLCHFLAPTSQHNSSVLRCQDTSLGA